MNTDLSMIKEIKFPGEILTFNIPQHWIEEYEDTGNEGMYYEDSPSSGTLRVKLLTMKSPQIMTSENVADVLKSINGEMITLSNNNVYKHYYEEAVDSGHQITIFYWSLAQILEPYNVRLVNFSYTILSKKRNIESTLNEIYFITKQVEQANLRTDLAPYE